MNWYHYVACFFAGLFAANVVPHFVHGISGDRFPTPFANPPGRGLSSPTVNVLWALLNLIIGYILFCAGKVSSGGTRNLAVFFAGFAILSILSSRHFAQKHAS
jgi:small-conductance mechanosensitive channel